jgi:hypothetical protein
MICLAPFVSELLIGQAHVSKRVVRGWDCTWFFCIVQGYGGRGEVCVGQMCDNTKNDRLGRGSARFVFCKPFACICCPAVEYRSDLSGQFVPVCVPDHAASNRCEHVHLYKNAENLLFVEHRQSAACCACGMLFVLFLVSSTLRRFDRGRKKSPPRHMWCVNLIRSPNTAIPCAICWHRRMFTDAMTWTVICFFT